MKSEAPLGGRVAPSRLGPPGAGVLLVHALLLAGGCALHHGDFALEGRLRVELSPPTGPLFYGIDVAQRGDTLIVSGFGRRSEPRGHVEIRVAGPDGALLGEARAEPLPPPHVPHRTSNYRFQASVSVLPPPGSTLHVTYVRGPPADRAEAASDEGIGLPVLPQERSADAGDRSCCLDRR